jgi:hypothetical protein
MSKDDVCGKGIVRLARCGVFKGRNTYTVRLHDEKETEIAGELNITTAFA